MLPLATPSERDEIASLTALIDRLRPIDAEKAPEWFHAGQLEAWNSDATEVTVIAGTQGGKTSFLVYWLLREIQRCAPFIKKLGHGKAIFAGPTLTLMEAQAIPAFKDLFEDELGLGKLTLGNKPVFQFSKEGARRLLGFDCQVTVYFAYTSKASNLESMTACCGVWDEAGQEENKQASYRAFNRRLKAARTAGFGRRAWGTTPYEHNWFKVQVHDRAEAQQEGFRLFRFVSWMNPLVSREECEKELATGMPLWEWQMMYLGLYTIPAGAIYDCFDARVGAKDGDTNVCEPFEVPAHWPRLLGQDFGDVNMGSLAMAEDPDSPFVYVYWSRLAGGLEVDQHAKAIKAGAGLKSDEDFEAACGGSWSEDDWRVQFAAAGMPMQKPPIREVWTQINRVYGMVSNRRLKFFSDCDKPIAQFVTYSRELDVNGEPIPGTILDKKKKHYCDAGRYIVSLRYPFAVWEPNQFERVQNPGAKTGDNREGREPKDEDLAKYELNKRILEEEEEDAPKTSAMRSFRD